MSYVKKVWADDTTPISAVNMNHIEQGILDAVPKDQLAVASGVATLDSGIKVPVSQLGNVNTKTILNFVGDNEIYRDDIEVPGGGFDLTWVKKKQCRSNITGVLRVNFDLKSDSSSWYVQGRIYINGVPRGVTRLRQGDTYLAYIEDFTITAGDLIQVYMTTYQDNTTYTGDHMHLVISVLPEVELA